MKKIDGLFVAIGMAVAGFMTWHGYYSNSHRDVPHIPELIYLILFPPSIGLMVTENASKIEQAVIILLLVSVNGLLYLGVCKFIRAILGLNQEK